MPVQITLNGQQHPVEASVATLESLVRSLGFQPDRVAMEVNGTITPRALWPATPVREGDRIELVQFVGGGAPERVRRSCSHRSP